MSYPRLASRVRPVISLKKLRSTVTIPAFDELTNEPYGYCLKLEGNASITSQLANGYELLASPATAGGIYFDLWFKPISMVPPQDNMKLFARVTTITATVYTTFGLSVDENLNIQFRIGKSDILFTDFLTHAKVNLGEWNHVGVVWNGTSDNATEGYIWLNGVKQTYTIAANQRAPLVDGSSYEYASGCHPVATTQLNGKYYLDEVRLWLVPPDDNYFENYAYAPRATGDSDADTDLLNYFRFNSAAAPFVDSHPSASGDVFAVQSGTPVVITTEEYPSALGDSYPRIYIPLDEIGQDFTLKFPQERPASADWGLAVYFTCDEGTDKRYFLWRSEGLRGVDYIPDYAGEKICYERARFEIWYNFLDREVSLAAPISIVLGQLIERSTYSTASNTVALAGVADTEITLPLPSNFPLTFE